MVTRHLCLCAIFLWSNNIKLDGMQNNFFPWKAALCVRVIEVCNHTTRMCCPTRPIYRGCKHHVLVTKKTHTHNV